MGLIGLMSYEINPMDLVRCAHNKNPFNQSNQSNQSNQLKIPLQQAAVPPLAGFPVRNFNRSIIRLLTPQQAAGNALAIAVQRTCIRIKSSAKINGPAYVLRHWAAMFSLSHSG